MSLQSNVFTTLAVMKTWLRVTGTDYDTLIEDLMNAVADEFESYCTRKFKADDYTEVYNGNGCDNIMVKNYPINSITSIAFSTSTPRDFTTLLSSDYYEIDETADKETINFIGYRTPIGKNTIQIIYNGGYSTIPSNLILAFKQAVEFNYKLHSRQDIGTDKITKGDTAYSRITASLPPEVKEKLQPYINMAQYNILGSQFG